MILVGAIAGTLPLSQRRGEQCRVGSESVQDSDRRLGLGPGEPDPVDRPSFVDPGFHWCNAGVTVGSWCCCGWPRSCSRARQVSRSAYGRRRLLAICVRYVEVQFLSRGVLSGREACRGVRVHGGALAQVEPVAARDAVAPSVAPAQFEPTCSQERPTSRRATSGSVASAAAPPARSVPRTVLGRVARGERAGARSVGYSADVGGAHTGRRRAVRVAPRLWISGRISGQGLPC